ncbi:hypothetical protein ACIA5G_42090 [Amycolatopsis sp. NPDC051758]|uniref:hypothetical protein n=1 Tax=Amycolatopsis sp. NPDC051758 TaxID=3363935 RepID=UPI0037969A81
MHHVAGRLIDGSLLVVRGLPRSGKTILSKAVADELGGSAFYFDGAAVDDVNQKHEHARLRSEVERRLAEHGCAQLVFDSYGNAVRQSRGGVLHSQLYGQLVDGPGGRDIGALFTSRYADALDLRVSGSPLLGRADFIELPRLSVEDAAVLGLSVDQARSYYGDTTSLAHAAFRSGALSGPDAVSDFVSANAASYTRDLPPDAARVLLGARTFSDADGAGRQALRGLGAEADGTYEVARAVTQSTLLTELRRRNPGWPKVRADSVARFAELLDDVPNALWVDRYVYEKPDQLAHFLKEVRSATDAPVRLLGKPVNDHANVRRDIGRSLEGIAGVDARVMAYSDCPRLHDRHLVSPSLDAGYILPTAGVILGMDDPGSAVIVRMPSIAFNYEACWKRGNPLIFPAQ